MKKRVINVICKNMIFICEAIINCGILELTYLFFIIFLWILF